MTTTTGTKRQKSSGSSRKTNKRAKPEPTPEYWRKVFAPCDTKDALLKHLKENDRLKDEHFTFFVTLGASKHASEAHHIAFLIQIVKEELGEERASAIDMQPYPNAHSMGDAGIRSLRMPYSHKLGKRNPLIPRGAEKERFNLEHFCKSLISRYDNLPSSYHHLFPSPVAIHSIPGQVLSCRSENDGFIRGECPEGKRITNWIAQAYDKCIPTCWKVKRTEDGVTEWECVLTPPLYCFKKGEVLEPFKFFFQRSFYLTYVKERQTNPRSSHISKRDRQTLVLLTKIILSICISLSKVDWGRCIYGLFCWTRRAFESLSVFGYSQYRVLCDHVTT
jgi:hypothetical protein